MTDIHVVAAFIGLGSLAFLFSLLLCKAVFVGICEDHAPAADAGGCPRCGTMLPVMQGNNGRFACPDCNIPTVAGTRIACCKCGGHMAGPLLPHEALHHRLGLCPQCASATTAAFNATSCPFGS